MASIISTSSDVNKPEYGKEGTNWQSKPYYEVPILASIIRGITFALGQLPHSITLLSFRTMLALPPDLSRSPLYFLTQPEYEDISRWREIVTDTFTGALMNLHGKSAINQADVTVLYVHGGAGVVGHARMFSTFFRNLLQAIEGVGLGKTKRTAQLLSVEYALLNPQNPPPKQEEEIVAAYRFLLSQGVQPEKIVLAGDSSGALFAIHSILHNTDIKPAGLILISPWVDVRHEYDDASWKSPANSSDIVTSTFLSHGTQQLSVGGQRDLKSYSPVDASKEDLARLPPSLATIGGAEKFADSIHRFCDKLSDCERIELAGGCHEWLTKKELVHQDSYAEREKHIRRIGEWIAARVGWSEDLS